MNLKTFVVVVSIHMALIYAGLGSLPLVQMGALALAFTVLSVGGIRLLRLR